MDRKPNNYRALWIYLVLSLTTFAVFCQVSTFDFVSYDDNTYITDNQNVKSGLSRDNIIWVFTSDHDGNWHPLTSLSHMFDCEFFGLNPASHHFINLLLHIINTLLLFAVLKQMTGAFWQSVFVAGAFALHPLHIEPVAWISSRKDVLSTFFWIFTMAAYFRHVKSSTVNWYLVTLLVFSLGLMSKPMLVTLPFVLLLLDYWPLGRLRNIRSDFYPLFREKIPFFALSAISSIITFLVEKSAGTMSSVYKVSIKFRVANAFVSYIRYIEKTIWPSKLAVLYPLPLGNLPLWQPLVSAVLLVGISAAIFYMGRRKRYLVVGWFWYLGTLLPVIGLVQIGAQAMADRYTYVPLIGLFIIIAWGVSDLLEKFQFRKIVLGTTAVIILIALSISTLFQLRYWRNSETLFKHALKVTSNNGIMHYNLGTVLVEKGQLDKAIGHFRHAIQFRPTYAEAHYNLANALHSKKKSEKAINHYYQAIQIKPDYAEAHNNLGLVLKSQGRIDEAISHYYLALQIRPDYARAYNNLGSALLAQRKIDEAILQFQRALKINPDYSAAQQNLATAIKLKEKHK